MTRGSLRTSPGSPSEIFSPWSSTVMYSETSMITFMSCSISTTVTPRSSRSLRMNAVRSADSCGFMPAVGEVDRQPVVVALAHPDVLQLLARLLARGLLLLAHARRAEDRAEQAG